jgi:hypothetical protein
VNPLLNKIGAPASTGCPKGNASAHRKRSAKSQPRAFRWVRALALDSIKLLETPEADPTGWRDSSTEWGWEDLLVRSSALLENVSWGDKQGRSSTSASCAGQSRSLWKPRGRSGAPLPQRQKGLDCSGPLGTFKSELSTLYRPRGRRYRPTDIPFLRTLNLTMLVCDKQSSGNANRGLHGGRLYNGALTKPSRGAVD